MSEKRKDHRNHQQETWTKNTGIFIEVNGPADTTRRPIRPEILRYIRDRQSSFSEKSNKDAMEQS